MAPPGMTPTPAAPAMSAIFSSMQNLAKNMPQTSMDKVREAMRLLNEARDEDDKIAENVSMGMAVIRDGPKAMEKFTDDRSL